MIHATMTRDVYLETHGRVITEGDVMVLTRSQKEAEDALFGPFSRMKLAEMPAAQALWDMIHAQVGSFKVQGKIGVEVFTQFIHWLAMQLVSKAFAKKTMTDGLLADFNRLVAGGDRDPPVVSPMAAFEFCADMVDSVVGGLAPDVFRVMDHNSDDDLSREEWVKFLNTITSLVGASNASPSTPNTPVGGGGCEREASEQVIDLVFTIIDKDNSKTLELEELAVFSSKILRIMVDVLRSGLTTLGRSASNAANNDVVHDILAALDKDGDGSLTPDEVFAGFHPALLAVVMQLPGMIKAATATQVKDESTAVALARTGAQKLRSFFDQVQSHVLSRMGATKDVLFDKIKAMAVSTGEYLLEALQRQIPAGAPALDESEGLKPVRLGIDVLRGIVEHVNKGFFDRDLRFFSDALFDLIDADKNGSISAAEIKVFTDLLLEDCANEATAKKRLMSVFSALDIDKSGMLSKDELLLFVSRVGCVCLNALALVVHIAGETVVRGAPDFLPQILRSYARFRQLPPSQRSPQETSMRVDVVEFAKMCRASPVWVPMYFTELRTAREKAAADAKVPLLHAYSYTPTLQQAYSNTPTSLHTYSYTSTPLHA
jgi:Ca2+-binding EF-hand superfamily protein